MNKEASSFIEDIQPELFEEDENIIVSYGEFPNSKMIESGKKMYAITYNKQLSEDNAHILESEVLKNIDDMGVFVMNLANISLLCTSQTVLDVISKLMCLFEENNIKFFVIPNREDRFLAPELFVQRYGNDHGVIFQINNINALISMLNLPNIDAKKEKDGNMIINPEFQEYYKKFQKAMTHKYVFQRILGVGSFGFVVLVSEKATGTKWALKILYRHEYPFIIDFIEEAKQLMHTHLHNSHTLKCAEVQFVLLEKKCSALYQKLEYNEDSVTLKKYLKKLNTLDIAQTRLKRLILMREIVIAIMNFVMCAVHWDLKPSNIMIKETKSRFMCWILDLGFSRDVDNAQFNKGLGTVPYIPPREQEEWSINPFFRDIFALFIILFEVYTGSEPFFGINEIEELEKAKLDKNICGTAELEKEEDKFIDKLKFMMDTNLRNKPINALLKKALRIIDNKIATETRKG